MDHHRINDYSANQECYDDYDLNMYSDFPLSDIQDYSDGTAIPSPFEVERSHQHIDAQNFTYYAYDGDDLHSQACNSPFQGHSSYDSRVPLELFEPLRQAEEMTLPGGGPGSRRSSAIIDDRVNEELGSCERYQYTASARSGTRLRPVSELPDVYRSIFKFGVFNAVQSLCFDNVYNSDENIVVSAPTGSGKTVLFELAILRVLHRARETGKVSKCVYVAPTKALCSERFRDWEAKFGILGIKCCELTGDTILFGKGAWGDARNAGIIITTAEKWDSLTRTWHDHDQILSQIKLFLVDEVHILNESRGSTLEVVVSRMKTRGAAVRFVLVSATVPNIQDVATWIGTNGPISKPAIVLEFGEEYRPCKLARIVVGVPRSKGLNDFAFAKTLDRRLFPTLQTHSVGKPILVFCSTRNGAFKTADQLKKDFLEAESGKQKLPWTRPQQSQYHFYDKRSNDLATLGIGVHHAGLTLEDRRTVEDMFIKGLLRIVVATSTLAVGVNLPAHTVAIKGVHLYQNNVNVEYSDLDIMQMIGRAGRPQFDTEGLAIIICESALEYKYRSLAQGTTVIESSLHRNLSEHLNSEVGLGTIGSVNSAKQWLRNSFLFQRIRKNPSHYALGKEENQTWEDRMDDLVVQNFNKLADMDLIEFTNNGKELRSTEYGNIMSKLYIRQYTMELILKLPERPSVRDILETIASAEEFQDSRIRTSEKTTLNILRRHSDIRFGVKKLEKTSDKVFIIIQAILGGISLNSSEYRTGDSQPHLEALGIFRHVCRIARAVVEVSVVSKCGAQMKHGLELLRCLTAKAWEDRPVVLRQIEQIGEKSLKVLAENGITKLQDLQEQDPTRIELLLNRKPPFGREVVAFANELPQYSLEIRQEKLSNSRGGEPIEVELCVQCGLVDPHGKVKAKKAKRRDVNMTVVYTVTSDMDFIDFRRIPTKALTEVKSFNITAKLVKPSQSVIVTISSETIAGVTLQRIYKPNIHPSEYPVVNTRPPTAIKMDPEIQETSGAASFVSSLSEKTQQDPRRVKADQLIVRDLTKLRDSSKLLQKLDNINFKNKLLPNGNYECNHSCKEKSQCRHLCCKEGLVKPPKTQARLESTATETQDIMFQTEYHSGKELSKGKQKMHAVLADIENRHASAQVEQGLKIKSGQRIRLHHSQKGQLVDRRAGDITSTNRDKPGNHMKRNNEVYDVVGRMDLPEDGDSVMFPECDCSDPGLDSIICALPMDGDQMKAQSTGLSDEKFRPIESNKRKLPLFFGEPASPQKRAKFWGISNLNAEPINVLDAMTEQTVEGPESDYIEVIEADSISATDEAPVQLNTTEPDMDMANELAELDEWLNSGAVDIV